MCADAYTSLVLLVSISQKDKCITLNTQGDVRQLLRTFQQIEPLNESSFPLVTSSVSPLCCCCQQSAWFCLPYSHFWPFFPVFFTHAALLSEIVFCSWNCSYTASSVAVYYQLKASDHLKPPPHLYNHELCLGFIFRTCRAIHLKSGIMCSIHVTAY